ncbi:ATP-dependent DNA helicase sgs1 [Ceratobasidium sp. 370]|nr:ATP-dependent DNA helicase sgs1 [Ceratobasidium sp. 370]
MKYDQAHGQCQSLQDVIENLMTVFWLKSDDSKFKKMAEDPFEDATVRFACLINLDESGNFATPHNTCHELVRIKYFMCAGLFTWSLERTTKEGLLADSLPAHPQHRRRHHLEPLASSHHAICEHLLARLPHYNVRLHHDALAERHLDRRQQPLGRGATAQFPPVSGRHDRLHRPVRMSRHGRTAGGASLETLGFDVTEETPLVDDLANEGRGYSVFSDPRNRFAQMKTTLGQFMVSSPESKYLVDGVDARGKIVYNDHGCAHYLSLYHKATRMLGLILHAVGGQPGRGTKFVTIKWDNPQFCQRNIFMVGPGRMVYVLFYNKTTGQTGLDRVVAHAIPWRIARLMLILRSLVVPFASELVECFNGSKARAAVLHNVLTINGEPMTSNELGYELQQWFAKNFEVDVRLRVFRQFIITCQHKYMPEAFATVKHALNVVDAQASHSTKTAEAHYALDFTEAHLFAEDTILKYITTSTMWWRVLFHGVEGMLTLSELVRADSGPQIVTVREGFSDGVPVPLAFKQEDVDHLAVSIVETGNLTEKVALHLFNRFMSVGLGRFANHAGNLPSTPPSASLMATLTTAARNLTIEPTHLGMLQVYLKDKRAEWSCNEQAQAFVQVIGICDHGKKVKKSTVCWSH